MSDGWLRFACGDVCTLIYFVNPLSAFVIIRVSDSVDTMTLFTKELVLTDGPLTGLVNI